MVLLPPSNPETCNVTPQWRAAGVLVYDFDEAGEMLLLLARQEAAGATARKNRFRHRAWNILGASLGRSI